MIERLRTMLNKLMRRSQPEQKKKEEKREELHELIERQRDVARRLRVLEWQTYPYPTEDRNRSDDRE